MGGYISGAWLIDDKNEKGEKGMKKKKEKKRGEEHSIGKKKRQERGGIVWSDVVNDRGNRKKTG